MEKIKVSFVNLDRDILFNDKMYYANIPKLGSFIIWHLLIWEVNSIIEDWDNKSIILIKIKAGD